MLLKSNADAYADHKQKKKQNEKAKQKLESISQQ